MPDISFHLGDVNIQILSYCYSQFLNMKGLLLFASLLSLSLADTCSSTLQTKYQGNSCTINFRVGAGCQSYSFQNCQISSCPSSGSCLTYTYSDFSKCMELCCSGSPSGDQYSFASQCASSSAQDPTEELTKILLAIMMTVGAMMVIALIICLICMKCRKPNAVNREEDQQNPQFEHPELNPKKIKCQPNSQQELSTEHLSDWKEIPVQTNDIDCVICLGCRPNLKLVCGHKFHSKCFAEWLKKKCQCGICRSMNVLKSTLICRRCFSKSLQIETKDLKLYVKSKFKQTCTQCLLR